MAAARCSSTVSDRCHALEHAARRSVQVTVDVHERSALILAGNRGCDGLLEPTDLNLWPRQAAQLEQALQAFDGHGLAESHRRMTTVTIAREGASRPARMRFAPTRQPLQTIEAGAAALVNDLVGILPHAQILLVQPR